MQRHPDPTEAEQFLRDNPGIRDFDLLLADTNGVLRGKRVQRDAVLKIYTDGMCLPGSVFAVDIAGSTVEATGLGLDVGDCDCLCWPIPGTLKPVPWEHGRGQLLLTMHELDGRPFFADPRQVLRRVLERFRPLRLNPMVAVELEFYLCAGERDRFGGPVPPPSPRTGRPAGQTQVYSLADIEDRTPLLDGIRDACDSQDLPAFTAVAEYAPGQFEINLKHRPDPLAACDDAVQLKRLLKAVARRHGLAVTFMAKPYRDTAGSGTHIHASLLDEDGGNVFAAPPENPPPRLAHAIGGLLGTMAEAMALWAPNVNSYRRFQAGSFVPLAPTWGHNNRTVAVRIPAGPDEGRRIEHRVAGADANPYLLTAAVLAGIHYGLDTAREPGPAIEGNADDQMPPGLPSDCSRALDALESAKVIPTYLGQDFCKVYRETRAAELTAFNRTVSPLEYEWYLDSV